MNAMTFLRLAGAATVAVTCLGSGAMASTLSFDPASTNGGVLQLDGSQGSFSVTQGQGTVYQNISINGTSYTGDMLVNLGNFGTNSSGPTNGLGTNGSNWSLFALTSISGTGSWNGSTFIASTAATSMQLYGVNNINLGFLQSIAFFDPVQSNTAVPSAGSVSNGTLLSFGVAGAGSLPFLFGLSDTACYSAAGFNGATSNCILLANGGSSSGTTLSVTDGRSPTESFDIDAILNADSANVLAGFFGGSIPNGMNLQVLSGPGTSESPIDVVGSGDPMFTSCSPNLFVEGLEEFLGTCDGQPVNWDGSPLSSNDNPAPAPEPGTLALLGTALVGYAAARRRRAR